MARGAHSGAEVGRRRMELAAPQRSAVAHGARSGAGNSQAGGAMLWQKARVRAGDAIDLTQPAAWSCALFGSDLGSGLSALASGSLWR